MVCDMCNHKAKLVSGERIYPHRPDLYEKNFWLCDNCGAYVGCHAGTQKALGRLANAELRYWKRKVHNLFDPLWKSGTKKRSEAYKWLADQLAIPVEECHIGMFDVEKCKQAVKIMEANK